MKHTFEFRSDRLISNVCFYLFYRRHQQYKLARYCEDIFGDMLLKQPLEDFPVCVLMKTNDL